MKRPAKKKKGKGHPLRHHPVTMQHLRKAYDEKRLKPLQENIDAQRKSILKSDALNNQVYADRMRSLGTTLPHVLAARKTMWA